MAYEITPMGVAEHLSGATKFATLSCDREADMDFEVFFKLHDYLEKTYPLVHATLEKEVIGKAALLYHWKGTGKSNKLPVMFMAHLDVVPEGNHADWKYPPYSGEIAEGFVWGRGSGDCKTNLICELEAIEYMISQGFTPDFDVYLAFGYNEEVSGGDSKSAAGLIARTLVDRGVKIGLVMDEGGGLRSGREQKIDGTLCAISVAEKGYADFEISRLDPGGHSSKPHKDGALDYIAKAILAISENQYPYRLTKAIKNRFEALAPYMTGTNPSLAQICTDMEGNWEALTQYLDTDPSMAAYFHTTMVATMAQGSAQANILPEKASIVVNCRLLEGDTVESVRAHIASIIPEGMQIRLIKGNDPSPASDINTPDAQMILDICRDRYGKDVILLPDVTVGGTDAKYMYEACVNVYRFGATYKRHKTPGGAHAVNEAVNIEDLSEGPFTYIEVLKRYADYV